MGGSRIKRVIQRRNPFRASAEADKKGRKARHQNPTRTRFFAEREVQNRDGSFPFGEGFLYADAEPRRRAENWSAGSGRPSHISTAGHRGSKRQQQDAFAGVRLKLGEDDAAVLVVADGVSASGPLASRASRTATQVFMRQLAAELDGVPKHESQRHPHIERALTRAAFAANFEVIRQVLLDQQGDGRFDAQDRRRVSEVVGVDLPTGRLSVAEMQRLAPRLDRVVEAMDARDRSALTTFAVAIAVDNDLYTYATGDAVVSLFRPDLPPGQRFIHLTERDQAVVELFKSDEDWREHRDTYENVITESLGDSALLTGTLRRYPNLLEPGDRVIAHSDGLGPRGQDRGLDRESIEQVLDDAEESNTARALVQAQLQDLDPDEYQDNIGVVVLTIE